MPPTESEDLEDLMEQAEAEVGALQRIGADPRAVNAADRAGLVQQERELVKRRPLGFPAFALTAGAVADFVATPRRAFRANRLLVTMATGAGVVIDSIQMGDKEQVLTPGVAVEAYAPAALTDSVPDNFDAVQANTAITVRLRNTSAGDATGTIAMKGSVVSTG
jgi:methyl coenzyme M reductase alpha subunit